MEVEECDDLIFFTRKGNSLIFFWRKGNSLIFLRGGWTCVFI
jgi:hypothetical protein